MKRTECTHSSVILEGDAGLIYESWKDAVLDNDTTTGVRTHPLCHRTGVRCVVTKSDMWPCTV